MPLLSSSIPNLVNGVSQQAPALRLSSQMEAQDNAYSSIVEGLGKRSPTQHIARLATTDISDALIHTINRDSSERYTLVVTDGDLAVYDMDGNAKTVVFPDGKTYLDSATPNTVMKALTVEDYTFITNTGITVEMAAALSTNPGIQSLVFVKQGQYGTKYMVYIDGFLAASHTTSSTVVAGLQTTAIATELKRILSVALGFTLTTATWTEATKYLTKIGAFTSYTWVSGDRIYITGGTGITPGCYEIASKFDDNNLVLATSPSTAAIDLSAANITTSTGWTITLQDSTILVKKTAGTAFSIRGSDSFGDRAMVVVKDSVQRFSDLPIVAPTGFLVEVKGDNSTDTDNYFVKFVPNNSAQTFDKGVWVETLAPGIVYQLDPATMPHTLVREDDGTFTFAEATWGDRIVGDATTAPNPSFVDSTINDLFFFRNRLGLLSDENVIESEAGGFFNFFPTTVTTVLDSDPIDIAADHTEAAALKQALPFQEELLIFAERAQFVLSSGNSLLTPSTATCKQTTAFDASLRARPVGVGSNIYFPFTRGDFSGLREYFVSADNGTKDASDITSHVPKYVPGVVTKLTATSTENVIAALSDTDQQSIYIYKFYWLDNQKLQSSWSKFSYEEGAQVLNADFIESTLYLVVQRQDGHHLEKIQFEPGQTDTGSEFVTRLDRRLTEADVTVSYNATTGITTWTLPYAITGTMRVVVRAGDDLPEGAKINTLTSAGTTITARGDYSDTLVYIGQLYTMRVRLSEQILREEARGGGQAQISAGRSQLRYLTINYSDTGYFSTEVTPTGRDISIKDYSGLTPGVNGLGEVTLSGGEFRIPILSQASQVIIELVSDSHLPCYFTGAEFETFYHSRSQRA